MATKAKGDRIGALVGEVESLAKRLRVDIRKRAKSTGLEKNLKAAADRLRKQAASAAQHVEKYVHELRKELEGSAKSPSRSKPKRRKAKA